MNQSKSHVMGSEEFHNGMLIIEGHRALDDPQFHDDCTSLAVLVSTFQELQARNVAAASMKKHRLHQ